MENDDNASKVCGCVCGSNVQQVDLLILCVFRLEELDCYEYLMPLYFPTDPTIEVGAPGQIGSVWLPRVVPPKEVEEKKEEKHENEENQVAEDEQKVGDGNKEKLTTEVTPEENQEIVNPD